MLHDMRLALRFLGRNLSFSAAAVGILAIGIGLSATLFAVVKGALIQPWPYRGYDRIVVLRGTFPTQGRTDFALWSAAEIDDFRRDTALFEHVIAGDARDVNLTYAGRPERVRAAILTPNAFEMLGVAPLMGRTLQASDAAPGAPPVVVVSYRFWQTRLGADARRVGQTLRIGDVPSTIVGVMPEAFVFWDRDLWMPLAINPLDARGARRYYVQAQLRQGVTRDDAAVQLRALAGRMRIDHPEVAEYEGISIAVRSLFDVVLRDLRPTLHVLLAAVGLVLVVATANLANATLAKGMSREGELAIRRAIGGSAVQLARQLIVESLVIGAAGGSVGAFAAWMLLPYIVALIPFGYVPAEAHVALDWGVLLAAAACALGCGVLIGLLPAIRASAVDPAAILRRADTRTGSRPHAWRDGFVVAQLALAIVVLGVAVSAGGSLRRTVGRDPGFAASDVLTAQLALPTNEVDAQRRAAAYTRILDALASGGPDGDAALTTALPIGELPTTLVSRETSGVAQRLATIDADAIAVSPAFFRVLGIPLVDGRAFDAADAIGRPPAAIVTRALARRLWPDDRAVGAALTVGVGRDAVAARIVGVSGDIDAGQDDAIERPIVFVPLAQHPPAAAAIAVRTRSPRAAERAIADAVQTASPDVPVYDVATLERVRLDALGPRLLAVTLLAIFGATVLALAAVGIYAVASQSMQERAQEVRLRLTFGADPSRLFATELLRAGRIVAVSAAFGSIAAVAAIRILGASFAPFNSGSAAPVAASVAVLGGIALAATALPAWRACHAPPFIRG